MYGAIGPVTPKIEFVLKYTLLLNLIFLLILPYIIGNDLNFTNFQILIEYILILLVGALTGVLSVGSFLFSIFYWRYLFYNFVVNLVVK